MKRTETLKQASERTGLAVITLRRYALRGDLPFTRPMGNKILIDADALDRMLEAGRSQPARVDNLARAREQRAAKAAE